MFLDMVCKAPPLIRQGDAAIEVDGDLSVGLSNERHRGAFIRHLQLRGRCTLYNHLVLAVSRCIPAFTGLIHVYLDNGFAL